MSRRGFRFPEGAVVTALLAALQGCVLAPPKVVPAAPHAPPANPLVSGNQARLLVDGPRTHKAMFDAMSSAREHINIHSYILDDGELGERLAVLLERKVAEGVKVHLMYDSVGSIDSSKGYFRRLREAGIAVCEFNPVQRLDKLNNRNHRKITVVDGRLAFSGGINISETYSSSSRGARLARQGRETAKKSGWRDTHVAVQGPVVAQFQRIFLDDWALQDCGPWREARFFPPPEGRGELVARVVRSDPGDTSEMYQALLSAIAGAQARVWLTFGYFVPDPGTKQALADAARRGVDVQLVLPGFSDFWAPVYAGRSHYDELLEAGVRIYEWHDALMHAKSAVIDGYWSSVGSTNLDWRSFVHNYEADLIVLDAGFARELERRFRLDVAASVRIDPEEFRRRPLGRRLKEWFARQWEYLL